jgi:hypothetical protein
MASALLAVVQGGTVEAVEEAVLDARIAGGPRVSRDPGRISVSYVFAWRSGRLRQRTCPLPDVVRTDADPRWMDLMLIWQPESGLVGSVVCNPSEVLPVSQRRGGLLSSGRRAAERSSDRVRRALPCSPRENGGLTAVSRVPRLQPALDGFDLLEPVASIVRFVRSPGPAPLWPSLGTAPGVSVSLAGSFPISGALANGTRVCSKAGTP